MEKTDKLEEEKNRFGLKNEPNRFRVVYKVMEGDNRAGGWGERRADVQSLGDVERFENVVAVYPAFIEVSTIAVDPKQVAEAIADRRVQNKRRDAERQVRDARRALEQAEQRLQAEKTPKGGPP